MKKRFLIWALILPYFLSAQAILKPSIGIGALPNDTDTICAFSPYIGSFDTSGYAKGDTVPDFTLYTTAGSPINLQSVLGQGKPVLLISGSLTCPVFRRQIPTINSMASLYANQLEIYIIYGTEAHPTTPSPYSGTIWIPSVNQQTGILYPQPTTYGARKDLVDTLLSINTVSVPILVDGVCNEWISNYGPAPNNAYLIDTTGVVYEKHAWFHRLPNNMYCAIDSLLGTNSGGCNTVGNNGAFSFSYVNDTIEYGVLGQILGVHATLTNNSLTDNAVVDIFRWNVNVPSNWSTAMCVDICLSPFTDSTQVTIPPGSTQDFTFYFYTDPAVDSIGFAQLGFRNVYNNQNKMFRQFWGQTNRLTAVGSPDLASDFIAIFPNPSRGLVYLRQKKEFEGKVELYDLNGKKMKTFDLVGDQQVLDLKKIPAGLYVLRFFNEQQSFSQKIVLK